MEDVAVEDLAAVAERAARVGGDYLAAEFRNGHVDGEYGPEDVKAVVDREAEARIRDVVADAYPTHAFHGEESGRGGGERYRWVVDPLDGTNNFASGLPAFATAVAVVDERGATPERVAAAIYEPLADSLYLARRDAGATVNGAALEARNGVALDHGTVSFVIGESVVYDPALRAEAEAVQAALAADCKRVINTWAPTVDWGLLARGSIEGLVSIHPNEYEQHAGALLAAESGVAARETESLYVGAADPGTAARLRDLVEANASSLGFD